jgi:hypothetical protein
LKIHLKVFWKHKRPLIAKAILSTKSNTGGIKYQTSNYTTEQQQKKKTMILAKNRYDDQWSK